MRGFGFRDGGLGVKLQTLSIPIKSYMPPNEPYKPHYSSFHFPLSVFNPNMPVRQFKDEAPRPQEFVFMDLESSVLRVLRLTPGSQKYISLYGCYYGSAITLHTHTKSHSILHV